MKKGLFGSGTTLFISTAVITVIILIGLITFGIATELKKGRQMAGLSGPDDFNPNSLPTPGAGILKQEAGRPLDCEGVIFRASDNGIRYVRESGAGYYYAAEVNNIFGIYILNYGYLLKVENPGLDIPTYKKLKHALYHCDGLYTQSGLRIVVSSSENKEA
ncbi:MAG: hypothetical protein KAJ06_01615 [Gammaproteobacteria bacterium]|nr:hypothetical protein [Gammaproteobacteria bacterium]